LHPSALQNCKLFFETYSKKFSPEDSIKVVEIGSQDVNGSLRSVCPPQFNYVGLDFVNGKGVDLILDDPYKLPLENNSADIILSSSCFEHSEMFWVLFLEIVRILKPGGLFYLNVPSNGMFHRWPVDCWRFYPDSGNALVTWAKRNGHNISLVESFISLQDGGSGPEYQWNDYVAIFSKFVEAPYIFSEKIINKNKKIMNGVGFDGIDFLNKSDKSEDLWKLWQTKLILDDPEIPRQKKIDLISGIINNQIKIGSGL
jgi:SAM-dependent methyltransferase